ncbi:MAG: hypothetical protein K2J16_03850 [Clostridia bacterium]|nr:hypothetical protein [Clostridia bacterium]
MNYNKNKLINECLVKYYETFAHTLDTADYVPQKYNKKILAYIFKNMKRQFRKVDREDRIYQAKQRKKVRLKAKQAKQCEKACLKAKRAKQRKKARLKAKRAKKNK